MNARSLICPECGGKESNIENKQEVISVKGENIAVESLIRVCTCGTELFDEQLDEETLSKAYDIYRTNHDILSPDQIKIIRETYGLSQRTLGKLLGWGEVTVHRYESGAIPDASHNLMLKALRNPEIVSDFLFESKEAIPKSTFRRAAEKAQALIEQKKHEMFKERLISRFRHPSLNLDSGFTQFDFEKFANVVLFFANKIDLLWKTKLNKLLFYADFLCFKQNTVSITGSKYIKFEHGPVPDQYGTLLWFMEEERFVSLDPTVLGEYKGHIIKALTEVDPDLFEDYEWDLLEAVVDKYGQYSSTEIRNISHEEKGWIETEYFSAIPYYFANSIE